MSFMETAYGRCFRNVISHLFSLTFYSFITILDDRMIEKNFTL